MIATVPMLAVAAFLFAPVATLTPSLPPAGGAEEPEIVIQAVRGKCRIRLDDRPISERELSNRAGQWAELGTPVRVVSPKGASYKCLSKIVFKLNDKGVRLVRFIERDETP